MLSLVSPRRLHESHSPLTQQHSLHTRRQNEKFTGEKKKEKGKKERKTLLSSGGDFYIDIWLTWSPFKQSRTPRGESRIKNKYLKKIQWCVCLFVSTKYIYFFFVNYILKLFLSKNTKESLKNVGHELLWVQSEKQNKLKLNNSRISIKIHQDFSL